MSEVITTSILQGFDQKNGFFGEMVSVQVQYVGTATRYKLDILHQCGKRVKTKSQNVLGPNSCVCRNYRGKTGRGAFRVKILKPCTNQAKVKIRTEMKY